MRSSWSWPHWFWPLAARTPSTRKGRFFTRTIWPTGSESGKSVFETVCPSRHTFSATSTSRAVKSSPEASGQLRMTM